MLLFAYVKVIHKLELRVAKYSIKQGWHQPVWDVPTGRKGGEMVQNGLEKCWRAKRHWPA